MRKLMLGILVIYPLLITKSGFAQMKEPSKIELETHLKRIVGERTPGSSDRHLAQVFQHVKETLERSGYQVELDSFPFSTKQIGGSAALSGGLEKTFQNIIGRKKGVLSDERIIIGAHFDSVPGSPGADDNASGVVVMLELARILAGRKWKHTVEFIGFNMEEWNMIGSNAYVKKIKQDKIKVFGMVSLEMVGFSSDAPKSQKIPMGFSFFYPTTGNFIAVVGNLKSFGLLNLFKSKMKEVKQLPVESLALPFNGWPVPAVRLSDHSPFWDAGYPALLITDTSFYRNPHYHGPTDTIETLNMDFMQKVTEGVAKALIALDENTS